MTYIGTVRVRREYGESTAHPQGSHGEREEN